MIKNLKISNFKSIDNLDIDLKKMNIFSGTNSSGKSTAIQGILLISQNIESKHGLNGPLVSIGEFREAKNFNLKESKIKFEICDEHEKFTLTFNDDNTITADKNSKSNLAKNISYGENKFHYLSCNRIGSQDIYFKNRTVNNGVGITGEYSIDYLCSKKDLPLEEELIKDNNSYTFLTQVNYWLKYIVGAEIKVEEISGTDVVKASYGIAEGKYSRPQNVGSGISYLISIIILCLGSDRNDIIIIENPEIHLHPLSQSRLCEFLYFISCAQRQIIIETHSDHIFNALRVGIAQNKMDKNDIVINFFKLGSDNCTRKYDIEIGRHGKIENPIPDLFDQFQLDLNKMIGV